jgi:hypothetical protein
MPIPVILAANLAAAPPKASAKVLWLLALTVFGGAMFVLLGYQRLGLFGGGLEPSAFMRIVRPFFVALQALQERPFLGFGLGSEAELNRYYIDTTFSFASQIHAQRLASEGILGTWGSIHFAAPAQFGILGLCVFFFLLDRTRGLMGCPRLVYWVFYASFGISLGAINSPLLWAPLLTVAAIASEPARLRKPLQTSS